ncbi:DUF4136 domain-containing protein [Hahella aquimaris]|uniref:DUF4136 domain-containing protein n=1 Tax=Hahella sp. HNIBRBA332 TaxID=3015983 RepID=UPI00273B8BC1|nr:DUF4136 domain-containing protein [Hahella sp. HNIBRBA332]WLQ17126.1 DUF4136 domain-containing protein [Hahella sp. HNIBRBA332]
MNLCGQLNLLSRVATLCALLLLGGCAGYQVRGDYAEEFDFSRIHTYRWAMENRDAQGVVGLREQRMRQTVEQALQDEGLSPAETADVLVRVLYRIDNRQEYRQEPGFGFWRPFFSHDRDVVAHDYQMGVLTVEMIEPNTNRVVWQGSSSRRMSYDQTPEEKIKNLEEEVRAIFERYPPQPAAQ